MSRQVGGHTFERRDALAVQEGPPSPAVRPGPIHGMGRAVRYRAHALTGQASAKRNAEHESHSTFARAHCSHDLRKRARCTQLIILSTSICASRAGMRGSTSALTFQLCRRNSNGPPGSVDRQRLVVGRELVKMQPHRCRQQPLKNSLPPASKCLSHVSGRLRGICDAWARARTV